MAWNSSASRRRAPRSLLNSPPWRCETCDGIGARSTPRRLKSFAIATRCFATCRDWWIRLRGLPRFFNDVIWIGHLAIGLIRPQLDRRFFMPFLLKRGGANVPLEVQRWQYFLLKNNIAQTGV